MIKRTYWNCKNLNRGYNKIDDIVACNESYANLIGSRVELSDLAHAAGRPHLHAPVIDIDFEAQLIPSSTPGHYHLYLDKEMSWWRYKRLLKALYKAGIIEKGYWKGSLNTRQTLVRKPGVVKEEIKIKAKPLHVIRMREIRDSMDGLLSDIESTEKSS